MANCDVEAAPASHKALQISDLACAVLPLSLLLINILLSSANSPTESTPGGPEVEKTTPLHPFGDSWPQAVMLTPLNSLDFRTPLQRIGHL